MGTVGRAANKKLCPHRAHSLVKRINKVKNKKRTKGKHEKGMSNKECVGEESTF